MKKIGLFALILLTVVFTGCFGGKKENKEIFERLLNTEIDKIRGKA